MGDTFYYIYINITMSKICKNMAAKGGAKAGALAGALAGAQVYDKGGAKAGVWLASKSGAKAGTKAGAFAGAEACIKAGALDDASAGASIGASAGAKAGAKAGAQAYDKAVVADGHSMRTMWRRGWPKANTEAAEAAEAAEADVCVAEIPPPFFMEENDFKPISDLYTEVYREGNGVEKIFELNKNSYYRSITIDMNNILKKFLKDRPNRIFVTIKNGQSQQFFVRSDYWKQNSNYLGNYKYVNKFNRVFVDYYCSGMNGRERKGIGHSIPYDTCNRHTYYREVPYLRLREEGDNCIDNCIDSMCSLSGGKSKKLRKNCKKSRKNRRSL
jgi:hypothetical protein